MLQAANTDLFNPIVPKDHNTEGQNIPFSLQIKPSKSQLKLVCGFFSPSALKAYSPNWKEYNLKI